MIRPNPRRQFLILFRGFLSRMIDLELIAARGEIQTLLTQFTAMLAAFSFTLAIYLLPRYGTSPLPHGKLLTLAWLDEEFLIATTMAIAGLFVCCALVAVQVIAAQMFSSRLRLAASPDARLQFNALPPRTSSRLTSLAIPH